MANELKHADYGVGLSRAEWEAVGAHIFDSQATGDLPYASSAAQLSRLAKGAARRLLQMNAGGTLPEWAEDIDVPGTVMAQAQPCFLAYNSASDLNVTGDATAVDPVDFDTEVFDIGGNFAADTFTAPDTGKYIFSGLIGLAGLDGVAHDVNIFVDASNRIVRTAYWKNVATDSAYFPLFTLVDMDANDTVTVRLVVTGGAKTVDIEGSGTVGVWFAGYLLAS